MPNRLDLLIHLARRGGYKRYLEIGVAGGQTFRAVPCEWKAGIDPLPGLGTVTATSDEYFTALPIGVKFDLILVDGDHRSEWALRDALHSLDHLSPGGTIVMHDCLPTAAEQMVLPGDRYGCYTGDVWRVMATLARHPMLDCAVGDFDWGCGVIVNRRNPARFDGAMPSIRDWKWEQYAQAPGSLFPILAWPELLAWWAGSELVTADGYSRRGKVWVPQST